MTRKETKANQPEKRKSRTRAVETAAPRPVGQSEDHQPQTLQRAAAIPELAQPAAILALGRRYGNRTLQRLLAQRQRSAKGFDLDDETARRINRARGGGRPLESSLRQQLGVHLGYDFSGVRVHTGPESDQLNRALSARAFATGRDVFFRGGEYDPGSPRGRELIAHELSHVIQQGTGRVSDSGGRMTVRPDSDALEQEARLAARNAAKRSEDTGEASVSPLRVHITAAAAIQRVLADRITPTALKRDHPAIIAQQADYDAANLKNDGKVRIKVPAVGPQPPAMLEIFCTQAVALARRNGTALANVEQLVDLQVAEETAARNDAVGTVINEGDYKQPGKVVHWITGAAGNRTHKHSAVVSAAGAAAGYNQDKHVGGGKGAGLYNAGKIKWPEGVTVKLTD